MSESDKKNVKGPGLSDLLLWKSFTRDIEPLGDVDWTEEEDAARERDQKLQENKESGGGERTVMPVSSCGPRSAQDPNPQLDRRTDAKLRKGKMPIEARLDLHGMTQDQAKAALDGFIQDAAAQGKRCVLVITGKGTGKARSSGMEDWTTSQPGVLKRRVPEWLSSPPLAAAILKTYPARPQDGGEGALYVYLKRSRE